MRHLASIQYIHHITPIEGADRIELAHVLGWQVTVQKGQFKVGDSAVYFEIDSFLPVVPEFEFLRKTSYKNSPILGEGFRLRTMKFRGEISQGLLMPISSFPALQGKRGSRGMTSPTFSVSGNGKLKSGRQTAEPSSENCLLASSTAMKPASRPRRI